MKISDVKLGETYYVEDGGAGASAGTVLRCDAIERRPVPGAWPARQVRQVVGRRIDPASGRVQHETGEVVVEARALRPWADVKAERAKSDDLFARAAVLVQRTDGALARHGIEAHRVRPGMGSRDGDPSYGATITLDARNMARLLVVLEAAGEGLGRGGLVQVGDAEAELRLWAEPKA